MQIEGLFDVPPAERSELAWEVRLPLGERAWHIGLIVGPSGCGKTTIARELWPAACGRRYDWPADRAVVDGFPETMEAREVAALLSSVGFSSPPAWLRPFGVLSNGEQFRVTIARALAEAGPDLVVVDEFTSVVDRTVAKIGSAAIAKTVRRRRQQFIAVGCHYDVIDWLQPDWIYEPAISRFSWRSLRRRPGIEIEIVRADRAAWQLFRQHHYLSTELAAAAAKHCWVGLVEGQPAAFTAVTWFMHAQVPGWREHRTVCLPDFQGVGIGNAMSDYVASLYAATGCGYRSTTASSAMIRHRARSLDWEMVRRPSSVGGHHGNGCRSSVGRATAGFVWRGLARPREARALGLCCDLARARRRRRSKDEPTAGAADV